MSLPNAYAPIGVFDSGVGGLSVVRRLRELLPGETLLYVADQAHVPYGGRDLKQVRGFACGISSALIAAGCKAIVMACNISSAVALESVQAAYPRIPVLGVIRPGVEAAVQAVNHGRIGVLATEGTVRSEAYTRTIHAAAPEMFVREVACPRFVPLVESGREHTDEARAAVREYLAPLIQADVEAVILGCTHYPFLLPLLQTEAPHIRFIDPAYQTTCALQDTLASKSLLGDSLMGVIKFLYTTGDADAFDTASAKFLAPQEYRLTVSASWRNGSLFLPGFPLLHHDALILH
jgi:glutamate racemase